MGRPLLRWRREVQSTGEQKTSQDPRGANMCSANDARDSRGRRRESYRRDCPCHCVPCRYRQPGEIATTYESFAVSNAPGSVSFATIYAKARPPTMQSVCTVSRAFSTIIRGGLGIRRDSPLQAQNNQSCKAYVQPACPRMHIVYRIPGSHRKLWSGGGKEQVGRRSEDVVYSVLPWATMEPMMFITGAGRPCRRYSQPCYRYPGCHLLDRTAEGGLS